MNSIMTSITGGIAAGSMFAALAIAQPAPHYTVTDLGTLGSGTYSSANNVSNGGFVVGLSAIDSSATSPLQAALWDHRSPHTIMDIGRPGLGGPNSQAYGINAGQIVGQAETSTEDPNNENFCGYGTGLDCVPFLWQDGAMTALPLLGGNNGGVFGNPNNRGQVAGVAENSTRDSQCPAPQVLDYVPVIWGPRPGQIRKLDLLPGDSVGIPTDINDNGQAVGTSGSCANTPVFPLIVGPHAVLWEADGSARDLGNLGGTPANVALSINNRGQVVGGSSLAADSTASYLTDAFLWTKETGMQDLGTLPGDVASTGLEINECGALVGPSFDAAGNLRAFIWQNGTMTDLNTLIPADSPLYLLFAGGINSSGEIAGFGVTISGDVHGFLLTPSGGAADDSSSPDQQSALKAIAQSDSVRQQVFARLGFRGR
jgi:probable HAF family extracellular repeat protein